VITGNDKVFSTGGDLKEALAIHSVEDTRKWLALFSRVNARIEAIGKPVIAAIHGYCVTGGLEMALACDIRIAATTAQFGSPVMHWHGRRGGWPAASCPADWAGVDQRAIVQRRFHR
jgi:enoyl-CoA hydratase/carnithine racemase